MEVGETIALTPAQEKARKRRNAWLALSIAAFCALVFAITLVRMGGAS